MDPDITHSPVTSDSPAIPTRRTLLALLSLGTLAGGLASLAAQEATEARRKKKGKKRRNKKRKGGKGGDGNETCNGKVNGSAARSDEDVLLQMINEFRAQNGNLPALTREDRLDSAAVAHSRDMAARCFFAHENPDGVDPFQRMKNAGYTGIPTAENLYKGSGNLGTAGAAFKAWRDSTEGHRENMLNPSVTEIGIGTALDGDGFINWTNVFGRRLG
jgi:uncharacterized protein YkwD